MFGRYRFSWREQIMEEYFDTSPWDGDWSPRYNTAPTESVPVIRQDPKEPIRQISTEKRGDGCRNTIVTLKLLPRQLKMDAQLRGPDLWFRCSVLDIGDLDGERLLKSSAVGDSIVALPAGCSDNGLILTCLGGAVGLVSARGLSHWMASLLFVVSPGDPLIYCVSGAVILTAALVASYLPSHGASSLNPIEGLRGACHGHALGCPRKESQEVAFSWLH
jgi:hypothetical protein